MSPARSRDHRAVLLESGGLAGLLLQRGEQLGGVFREFRHVPGRAQLADEPGGVPGRAAGQLLAFEERHVGDADLGEVIGDRTAGDAAPHDRDIHALRYLFGHIRLLPSLTAAMSARFPDSADRNALRGAGARAKPSASTGPAKSGSKPAWTSRRGAC
jgi:hypothetical protein